MYIVRKGYTVFWRSYRLVEGEEVPPQALDEVLKAQGWKVEEKGVKKDLQETVFNRMIKDKEVKKT
jgi:hypothetical protein